MGIDIDAKLIFGAPYKELAKVEGMENLDDLIDEGELDYASPHYDSDRRHWIVGVALPNEMQVWQSPLIISDAQIRFLRLTKYNGGRLIVSPDVT